MIIDLPIVVNQLILAAHKADYPALRLVSHVWNKLLSDHIAASFSYSRDSFITACSNNWLFYLKDQSWQADWFIDAFRGICASGNTSLVSRFIKLAKMTNIPLRRLRKWHVYVGLLPNKAYKKWRSRIPDVSNKINDRYRFMAAYIHDDVNVIKTYIDSYLSGSHFREFIYSKKILKHDASNILEYIILSTNYEDISNICEFSSQIGNLIENLSFIHLCCKYKFGTKCLAKLESLFQSALITDEQKLEWRVIILYNAMIHNQFDVFKKFANSQSVLILNKTMLTIFRATVHSTEPTFQSVLDDDLWHIEYLFEIYRPPQLPVICSLLKQAIITNNGLDMTNIFISLAFNRSLTALEVVDTFATVVDICKPYYEFDSETFAYKSLDMDQYRWATIHAIIKQKHSEGHKYYGDGRLLRDFKRILPYENNGNVHATMDLIMNSCMKNKYHYLDDTIISEKICPYCRDYNSHTKLIKF